MSSEVAVAIISGLAGPVAVVVAKAAMDRGARRSAERQVQRAEAESRSGDPSTMSAVVLRWAQMLREDVERVQRRIGELEEEVARQRGENALLRRHNELLSSQVVELGGTPWVMPQK